MAKIYLTGGGWFDTETASIEGQVTTPGDPAPYLIIYKTSKTNWVVCKWGQCEQVTSAVAAQAFAEAGLAIPVELQGADNAAEV